MKYCSAAADVYEWYEDICWIPDSFSSIIVGETTRSVCRTLCSNNYDVTCSGFLYDRRARQCNLTAYTGEWVEADQPACQLSDGMEFYRRIRSLGLYLGSVVGYVPEMPFPKWS